MWFLIFLRYRQNELVTKIRTRCEELTAHKLIPLFQHHLHRPRQNLHTPSGSFHRLLISAEVVLH